MWHCHDNSSDNSAIIIILFLSFHGIIIHPVWSQWHPFKISLSFKHAFLSQNLLQCVWIDIECIYWILFREKQRYSTATKEGPRRSCLGKGLVLIQVVPMIFAASAIGTLFSIKWSSSCNFQCAQPCQTWSPLLQCRPKSESPSDSFTTGNVWWSWWAIPTSLALYCATDVDHPNLGITHR